MNAPKLTPRQAAVFAALKANTEGEANGLFSTVYLDNARPADMSAAAFAGHLGKLEQAGLYRPVDGFAFGEVMTGL